MSALTEARRHLAGLLEAALAGAGYAVVDHVPEELPTPCVVLEAADPWLERGETYDEGGWWVTLRVHALVNLAANAQATEDLEALLTEVLPALAASPWEVDPLPRPGPLRTSEWFAHGVTLTVRNLVTISPAHNPAGETP